MKRLLFLTVAAALLLLPLTVYAQTGSDTEAREYSQTAAKAPPISQELVREGDFALLLVEKLKLGTAETEVEAEDMLSAAGVMPKNGWIADYPVTPDIIGELEDSVAAASEAGGISLGKSEAADAIYELTVELGIPVRPATADQTDGIQVGETTAEYLEPAVIEYHYYEESPPVITYYAPPYDYYYLYGWVPYPFWWYGFYFPGYYILNDFHVVSHFHHHHKHFGHRGDGHRRFVSNHVRDRHTDRVGKVDRVSRRVVSSERRARGGDARGSTGYTSADSRRGASKILDRSLERGTSGRTDRAAARAERRDARQDTRSLNRDARRDARSIGRDTSGGGKRAFDRATRGGSERTVTRGTRGGGSDRSFTRSTRGGGADRSFTRSTRGGGADRSFSGASRGGGARSFSGGGSRGGGARSFGGGGSRGGGARSFGGGGSRGGGARSFGGGGRGGGSRGGGGCRGKC